MVVQALKFLVSLTLRRVRRTPIWVWILSISAILVVPNALAFWFGLNIENPWIVAAGGVAGIIGFAAYTIGFSFDNDWLGIPNSVKNDHDPRSSS